MFVAGWENGNLRGTSGPPSSNHRTPLSDDTLYCLTPPEDD